MKIKITKITEWRENWELMGGNASHIGDRAVQKRLESERVEKIDNGKANGLPFVCEAKDWSDALEKYNETHCKGDYLTAEDCECEEVEE